MESATPIFLTTPFLIVMGVLGCVGLGLILYKSIKFVTDEVERPKSIGERLGNEILMLFVFACLAVKLIFF